MDISIIVAVAEYGVIGKDNQLLWRLSEDLDFMKNTIFQSFNNTATSLAK
jgi:dihydrofolate reductase